MIGGYALLWLLVAVLVRSLLRRWLHSVAQHQKTEISEVLAATVPRTAAIATFLLAMSACVRYVPMPLVVSKEVQRFFPMMLGILGISALMRVAFRAIDAYGRSLPELKSTAGIGRAATWIVGLAAMALFVSEALGISLAPALTALGVGSLAVALALQDTLSNFFAGLYLLADKPIRAGDYVKVDTNEGYVDAIGWRTTQLRTLGNNLIIVPNATFAKAVITNYQRPSPRVSVEVRIDVSNEADPDAIEALLNEEAARAIDIEGVLAEPAPAVRFAPGIGDGTFGFTVFIAAKGFAETGFVQHAFRKRVLARFRAAKVPLPGPKILRG
jgi:small-conductance mechanosensitive channel